MSVGASGVPAATVWRILQRNGLNRLAWIDRPTGRVIRRYERSSPGERFNRTLADEFLYAKRFRSEFDRRIRLKRWVQDYNCHRHHTAVGGPPASRANNLTRTNS